MDYQTVAQTIKDFITFQAEIEKKTLELEELERNPPKLDKDPVTWEEAVAFAEGQKEYSKKLETLRLGIANRRNMIQNKEQEIGEMLPLQEHYILFKIMLDGKEETYKIGYFPKSYGFRMEKADLQ